MPRYSYVKLQVMCYEPKDFALNEMRAAVEYLKTKPDSPHVGLVAIARQVRAGQFLLAPKPMINLKDILGKKPSEVWEMFDNKIDLQREGLARPATGRP